MPITINPPRYSWNKSETSLPAAAGGLSPALRVKVDSSGNAALAGDEKCHAVTRTPASAGEQCIVRWRNAPGIQVLTVSEAVTVGATLYAAASGKVATTGTYVEGIALTAADADGDEIETLMIDFQYVPPE